MTDTIRIMVIPPATAEHAEIKTINRRTALHELQEIVGGRIESTLTYVNGTRMLINDEGKLQGMKHNAMATALYPFKGDDIVGPAVLIGLGYEADEAYFDDLTEIKEAEAWSYIARTLEMEDESCGQ